MRRSCLGWRAVLPAVLGALACGTVAAADAPPLVLPAPDLTPGVIREARGLAAGLCQGCHGMDGLSKQANAPNIAAQPFEYLVAQLGAYRGGQRRQEQMSIAVQNLTDQEIATLAAYYAAIEIEAISIPGR